MTIASAPAALAGAATRPMRAGNAVAAAARTVGVLLLSGLLAVLPNVAHATFHLWVVSEVFSDASGNVQYVEFTTTFDGQELLNGQTLLASRDTSTRSFTFPANLPVPPGTTANRKFLVATQSFANLNIVTPDYVVPDKFLFIPNGTITLVGADTLTYAALPTNGTQSIDRSGNAVTASPTNFAGNTGVVNVPPPTPAGVYDIDANGVVDALTDGLLLIRYLFGLRGDVLIANAVGPNAARNTAAAIQQHIDTQIP